MNLTQSPERLAALERFLTRQRLSHYLDASDGDLPKAIALYELNAKISAIMYGPVQGLEILLRNAINEQLVLKFGENWYELNSIRLSLPQARDVVEAVRDLEDDLKQGEEVTNGGVVAKLSLGFWSGLLNSSNDNEIWRKAVYRSFPHRPKGIERKAIHGAINAFRRLRNRIAHHEKILHRNLKEDHERILSIAGWICPETRGWIESLSEFNVSLLPNLEATPEVEVNLSTSHAVKPSLPPTLNDRPRLSIKEK